MHYEMRYRPVLGSAATEIGISMELFAASAKTIEQRPLAIGETLSAALRRLTSTVRTLTIPAHVPDW
jgi:hypothetical protein